MKREFAFALAFLSFIVLVAGDLSRSGGAGHSLLFRDHGVVIENFQDLAPNAFTFEAWLRTTDDCHRSAIFSYAERVDASASEADRTAAANAFVIFDPSELVACRGFEYIDLWPDPYSKSCYAAFNHSATLPSIIEKDGRWHHLAVTWTAANKGLTKIYVDGLLRAETPSGKTSPLKPGGALMLGAEQDCYGGCTDRGQGFYGEMDEVRIWRVERSQEEILKYMRDGSSLDRHQDLAAYWRFNDPEEEGLFRGTVVAKDASGRGNDLRLITLPTASPQRITASTGGGAALETGALTFHNNYAMNQGFQGMPDGDITIEFWARTPAYNASTAQPDIYSEFLNFAAVAPSAGGGGGAALLDDAILIEKYSQEFRRTSWLDFQDIRTRGSISVHINANRQGMGQRNDHWIDYNVGSGWVDSEWHHVAVTWTKSTGDVALYYDGKAQTPFWRSSGGVTEVRDPAKGGVSRSIAAGSARPPAGSLVLGNKQESYGGGFSPQYSMHGDLANLRIWNKVLREQDVQTGMWLGTPPDTTGLMFSYSFDPVNVHADPGASTGLVKDTYSSQQNDLYLSADAPQWVYSTAPLALPDGTPVAAPTPGAAGHAFYLSDQQVLIHKNFHDFPSDELTVEFWMQSTDTCRKGVPFSYATGGYAKADNSFLIFDYNDWGISVMEDEGHVSDHTSGVASTDGLWTHVAVTWRSFDGETKLYLNGREAWTVHRGRGKHIPSGGTLVIGREQDCEGGCFDSDLDAAGQVEEDWEQEYGSQDFFGLIDEMRVWRKSRSADQITASMRANLATKGRSGGTDPVPPGINPSDPDLVAYWTFDEGKGYTVRDVTGKGHDLLATQPPRWEVVRWLAVCGNGIIEGLEECDSGNVGSGTGCTAECTIEKGWECTKTSPSVCWKSGENPPVGPPGGGGGDSPSGKSDAGGGGGGAPGPAPPRHGHPALRAVFATLAAVVGVGAIVAALVTQREVIYDRFPVVETAAGAAQAKFAQFWNRVVPGSRRVTGYSFDGELHEALDPEGSPHFTQSMPPPGRGGYSPLPAQAPQGPFTS